MTPLCQHLMPTGKTCQSPALSGQPLCFHHDREATQTAFILTLPALTDRSSILLALSQVVVAMGLNQIDTKRANLLLRSMNLATRLISAIEKEAKAAQKPPLHRLPPQNQQPNRSRNSHPILRTGPSAASITPTTASRALRARRSRLFGKPIWSDKPTI